LLQKKQQIINKIKVKKLKAYSNKMRVFQKYDIWTLSHELTLLVFKISDQLPSTEKYNLIAQIQRASYSIPSNFSEGCGRDSDKDFNRFLQICLGSAHELEYFFILIKDLNYISQDQFDELSEKINTIKKKLYSLSQKLIQSYKL
jgi:four helix bundle protein